jgi:hypothetical protein
MPFSHHPVTAYPQPPGDCLCPGNDPGACTIWESPTEYRPRHPERTSVYQLFQDHFDSYVQAYEERFEPRSGPLWPVSRRFCTDPLPKMPSRAPSGV